MKEVWKDIPGYEGIYQASNLGRIKSVKRIDLGGRKWPEKIMSQSIVKGYAKVGLHHARINKQMSVHRLVALAFIPNPSNLPQINHKDENPLNNHVENLEWCDCLYNMTYGTRVARAAKKHSETMKGIIPRPETMKRTAKISLLTGETLEIFASASEAARKNGVSESKISMVCNGKRKTAGGYKWCYIDESNK